MSYGSAGRSWDAETYDRVAEPQLAWAHEVMARLPLDGDETVLDAGCGPGRVTLALVDRLPRGEVIAVDGSPAMVARARKALDGRAQVLEQDLASLELAEPVDAIFSNAVFHWIPEHEKLFERLYAALRPSGVLVAQCGGDGNLASLAALVPSVAARTPFAEHLAGWNRAWEFPDVASTSAHLEAAGFGDIRCLLEKRPTEPGEPLEFLRMGPLGPYLDRLPPELHESFVDTVANEMGDPLVLDYVRLNIDALRPA